MMAFCYLRTQRVDNARIAENHQHQWQNVSNEQNQKCHRLLHSDATVDAVWYADSVHYVRSDTRHHHLDSWDHDPVGANHGHICLALLDSLLQTSPL